MGRRKPQSGPHIVWRNGRAYGDFRSYADLGGGREALAEEGSTWGTTDKEIAQELFRRRLTELQEMRRGRVGVPTQRRTTLETLVDHHLLMKANAGNTSDSHLEDLEARLAGAVAFFGEDRDPSTITPEEVREWSEALAVGRGGTPESSPPGAEKTARCASCTEASGSRTDASPLDPAPSQGHRSARSAAPDPCRGTEGCVPGAPHLRIWGTHR